MQYKEKTTLPTFAKFSEQLVKVVPVVVCRYPMGAATLKYFK